MAVAARSDRPPVLQRPLTGALVVALGLVLAGALVAAALLRARDAGRFAEVTGTAEREVTADFAIWPLRFSVSADDLGVAEAQVARASQAVLDFLARHNIEAGQTEIGAVQVLDARGTARPGPRFVVSQTVLVRSERPLVIQAASQDLGQLIGAGVALTSAADGSAPGPIFQVRKVANIEPLLAAEAAVNARKAADQLAHEAGLSVGDLRDATRHPMTIQPRDPVPGEGDGAQLHKLVRVEVTARYALR